MYVGLTRPTAPNCATRLRLGTRRGAEEHRKRSTRLSRAAAKLAECLMDGRTRGGEMGGDRLDHAGGDGAAVPVEGQAHALFELKRGAWPRSRTASVMSAWESRTRLSRAAAKLARID